MTPRQAIAFVKQHGIVLQAARGPAPNLAEAIAGAPIRGSWWAHPRSHEMFRIMESVCEHPDVLVCKLVDGKVTYAHRRVWPALVKLAARFPKGALDKIWDEHTASGKHVSRRIPFPEWVPPETLAESKKLDGEEAERLVSCISGDCAGREPAQSRNERP